MARRMTPAQFKSHLRQQANQRRQAINRYNQAVQSHNRKVKTTIDNYNREVRAYNQRLRASQQRVQQAIRQLQSRPVVVTRYVTFRTSVETLHRSYVELDRDQGYVAEMFNSGTHGEAAGISFPSLVAVKTRVEDGIGYLSRVFA